MSRACTTEDRPEKVMLLTVWAASEAPARVAHAAELTAGALQDWCTPDLVVCPEADPLWDGSVLLGLLGQLPLDEERLLGRLQEGENASM